MTQADSSTTDEIPTLDVKQKPRSESKFDVSGEGRPSRREKK